jgi:hypothetical protein
MTAVPGAEATGSTAPIAVRTQLVIAAIVRGVFAALFVPGRPTLAVLAAAILL